MDSFSFSLSGATNLIAMLAAAGPAAEAALGKGLYAEALAIFAVSQRLTPVKRGALKSSGVVGTPTKSLSGGIEVLIGYGGTAAPYAVYVHEITTNKHKPPTQAKFLEKPVMDAAPDIAGRLAGPIETALGGRRGA